MNHYLSAATNVNGYRERGDGSVGESEGPTCRLDRRGIVTAACFSVWPLLGLAPDDLIGRPWGELIHPGDVDRVGHELRPLIAGNADSVDVRVRFLLYGGGHRWLRWLVRRDGDGFLALASIPEVEAGSVTVSDHLYSQLVESAQDAIGTTDPNAVITGWNPAAARLYGYTPQEAIGAPISIIVPPERRAEEFTFLAAVLGGEQVTHYETERIAKGGRRIAVSMSLSAVRNESDEIIGVAAIARDITESKEMERRLRFLAHHDPLTGLYNRTRFEEELEDRLARARRTRRSGALLAIDLDDFKVVNDTYGHAAGDALLQSVGTALDRHVRSVDAVARMGGDEFAVVMSDIDPDQAMVAANKLLGHITSRWEHRLVTPSIGLVSFDGSGDVTPSELLIAVDVALYEAKHLGRNQVAQYQGRRAEGLSWVKRIRRALDTERLVVHAQPIIDLESRRVTHEELLIRMLGEHGELVPPADFLPTAERFRMIGEIDRWVTARAIELASGGRRVAVNLSGMSIGDERLMGELREALADPAAGAENIIFEITETAALERMEDAMSLAGSLAALGCSFALDDFGTGFVHFGLLKHLPVRYIKIDAEFVRGVATSRTDRHVIDAIVALARGFGQRTIAEGVETDATLAVLRRHGIDAAQGYLIGRPQPLAAA